MCHTAPPEIFDPKMRRNKFHLFINANGISYEVCKMLKGKRGKQAIVYCCMYEVFLIFFNFFYSRIKNNTS